MQFKYTAKNTDNKSKQYKQDVTGFIAARSERAAVNKLMKQKLIVKQITEVDSGFNRLDRLKGVTMDDKILFARQMAVMLKSGVDILDATHTVARISNSSLMRHELRKIHSKIKEGQSFSDSLPEKFDGVIKEYVRVGETTGDMAHGFDLLAKHFIFLQDTKRKVKKAVNEPKQLFITITVMLVAMMIFVIPDLVKTLQGELPWPTRLVMGVSAVITETPHYILLTVFWLYMGWREAYKRGLDKWLDEHKFKIPVAGTLMQRYEMTCFTRTFASLFGAGVLITDALPIAASATNNKWFKERIDVMNENIQIGRSIHDSAVASNCFDLTTETMISVADKTGRIDGVLNDLSDYYKREVDFELSMFNERVQPYVLYASGGLVLLVVLAVYLPMLQQMVEIL